MQFESPNYINLKTKILKKESVLVKDASGLHEKRLLGVLGRGGSKEAIKLHESPSTLLVPNMFAGSSAIEEVISRWKRIVYEEVAMSQLLTKIGLLSPLSQ